MATPKPATGRIDRIIKELEGLYGEAQDIFNAHVDYALAKDRSVISFGEMKTREIARPAGSTMNYVSALKIVRKKITGEVA
jgi:hypothetical protein